MAALTDPIADFLTRLKNSSAARQESFRAPYSRIKADIAKILAEEGFIWKYEVETKEGSKPEIVVTNRYDGKRPVLTNLKRVSKPGRRQYCGSGEIPKMIKGFGISIISTPKGVMSGAKARKANVGGEMLAHVW